MGQYNSRHVIKHVTLKSYIYSFKVRHLEYVINYSCLRLLRNLYNLHRKPRVTRNFATLFMGRNPYYFDVLRKQAKFLLYEVCLYLNIIT